MLAKVSVIPKYYISYLEDLLCCFSASAAASASSTRADFDLRRVDRPLMAAYESTISTGLWKLYT